MTRPDQPGAGPLPTRNRWQDGEGGAARETRWLTPRSIVGALGHFDLDPCGAPGHWLATTTFLLEAGQDGLALAWRGRVWLNPPYGRAAEPFLDKMAGHGRGTALLFARTETRVFHEQLWGKADGLLFLRGRIKFLRADGSAPALAAGAPSVLAAYGERDAEQLRESGLAGHYVDLRAQSGREALAAAR